MISPGTVLQNRYLVERQIGEGGMGAVYLATDQRFGSTVALKETFFDDPNLRKAFEREAKLLNHLRHSALPRVSDHFTEEEGQFIVMEYIPGEDLSEMLKVRAAPFAVGEVLAWADQLLDALEYLHTQTPPVIHRDIKPQNLKLLPRNQIVLLDFGLAKGTPLQTRVTATGSVFGYSFNYAPIEQMQGTGTDPRSDLYSLGATLYHLLTAATPPDALTRATAVLNGDPDPLRPASETNAHVPAEVSAVLTRSMHQSASRRFATAEEMRDALRQAGLRVVQEVTDSARASGQQTTILQERTSLSENETRLMDAHATNRIPLVESPVPLVESGGGKTEAFDESASKRSEAATLLNTEVLKSEKTGVVADETAALSASAATVSAGDAAQTSARRGREDASVVTRVRVVKDTDVPRRSSRRALGVVAALVGFALVAAAVYSFNFRRAAPVEQPAAQPSPANSPLESPQASATSAQPVAESANAPQPTPAVVAQPTQPAHTPAPVVKEERPQNENRPAAQASPPTPPAPAERPESDAQAEAEADAMFRNRDWVNNPPSQEEISRWAEQHPRAARALARKIREEQRRRGMRPHPPSRLPPPHP
jgi:serine/threonine protein kinase